MVSACCQLTVAILLTLQSGDSYAATLYCIFVSNFIFLKYLMAVVVCLSLFSVKLQFKGLQTLWEFGFSVSILT